MEALIGVNPRDAALTALGILDRELRPAAVKRGSVALALSGGHTPESVFRHLALPTMQGWPVWSALHVFWVDERAVPPDDPDSNYRLAWDTFLSTAPVDASRIHRMRGEAPDLEAEARRYEGELAAWAGIAPPSGREPAPPPALDAVLLGLGADGHTASLFPQSPALQEDRRWTVSAPGPPPHTKRLTVTLPLLNAARAVLFLVTGRDKAEAVRRAIQGSEPLDDLPAAAVRPTEGRLYWILDEAAASLLDERLADTGQFLRPRIQP